MQVGIDLIGGLAKLIGARQRAPRDPLVAGGKLRSGPLYLAGNARGQAVMVAGSEAVPQVGRRGMYQFAGGGRKRSRPGIDGGKLQIFRELLPVGRPRAPEAGIPAVVEEGA